MACGRFENIYLSISFMDDQSINESTLYNPFIIPSDPRPKIEPAPIQALIDR